MAAARRLSPEQIVAKLREAGVLPTAYLVLHSGGAALLARHVTARPTQGFDLLAGASPGRVSSRSSRLRPRRRARLGCRCGAGIRSQPCVAHRKASLFCSQMHFGVEV